MKKNQKYLYRFLDPLGAMATLESQSLRLTAPGYLNDPHDLLFKKRLPFSSDEFLNLYVHNLICSLEKGEVSPILRKFINTSEIFQELLQNLNTEEIVEFFYDSDFINEFRKHSDQIEHVIEDLFKEEFKNHFLLCLTSEVNNPKMWEKYGQNGSGIVLKFCCLPERDNMFMAAVPVKYSDDPPVYGSKDEWINIINGAEGIDIEAFYNIAIAWKHSKWSYENEWRIVWAKVEDNGKQHSFLGFSHHDLSEVILGTNISEDNKFKVKQIVDRLYPGTKITCFAD